MSGHDSNTKKAARQKQQAEVSNMKEQNLNDELHEHCIKQRSKEVVICFPKEVTLYE